MPTMTMNGPVLSTDHLSPDTCGQLDRWCETIDLCRQDFSQCPTLMAATDYGWLVFCTEDQTGMPDDLARCIKWARKRGHTHILFDANGDRTAELPELGGPTVLTPLTSKGHKPRS
jgi:hypothetical protein